MNLMKFIDFHLVMIESLINVFGIVRQGVNVLAILSDTLDRFLGHVGLMPDVAQVKGVLSRLRQSSIRKASRADRKTPDARKPPGIRDGDESGTRHECHESDEIYRFSHSNVDRERGATQHN
jgi:hypothetical protein